MVMTARRARLEAAQRREVLHGDGQDAETLPKAPPAGVQVPASKAPLPQPALNLLREKVQREEERQRQQAGGYYVSPPGPNHQQDRERLLKLEEVERQRLQDEELQRQAAQQEVPQERVYHVQEVHVVVPELSAEVPQVDSATTGSSSTSEQSSHTRRLQAVDDQEDYYWENI
eukprot:3514009-Amphidinium_carterae.3